MDTFDDVGPWMKVVRPGERAIELAREFAPGSAKGRTDYPIYLTACCML